MRGKEQTARQAAAPMRGERTRMRGAQGRRLGCEGLRGDDSDARGSGERTRMRGAQGRRLGCERLRGEDSDARRSGERTRMRGAQGRGLGEDPAPTRNIRTSPWLVGIIFIHSKRADEALAAVKALSLTRSAQRSRNARILVRLSLSLVRHSLSLSKRAVEGRARGHATRAA